jgi:DNA-binding FadR family transcriptional regulator
MTSGEVKRVADAVLARIIGGAYPIGLRLPSEVELAEELSCGRSTVREALQHLATLGVVRSRRGSGAHVLDFRREGTPALLPAYLAAAKFDKPLLTLAKELLHLRALLATEAVRLAAEHAPAGALGEAREVLARAVRARDPVEQAMAELELFRSIVSASEVWPAVWLANTYWAPLRETHALLAPALGGSPASFAEAMSRLLDLVEKRDADGAVKHLGRWLAKVDAALLDRLAEALGEAGGAPAPPALAGLPASGPSRRRRPPSRRSSKEPSPSLKRAPTRTLTHRKEDKP